MRSTLIKISGPLIACLLSGSMYYYTRDALMAKMVLVCVWMAVWWITECVSLYITALLPLVLFPAFGIMDMKQVAPLYNNEIIFLFTGGFILAFGLEKWNLHKRIALHILRITGPSPSGILAGFMGAGYFISMWISNIATTMMLLPAVLAVLERVSREVPSLQAQKYSTGLLLGLAYACSIGGTATLVGTAPNMIFMSFYNDSFPNLDPLTFSRWMIFALPLSILMFLGCFQLLRFVFITPGLHFTGDKNSTDIQLKALGLLKGGEKRVLWIFLGTVFLWFFRADLDTGVFKIPGWSSFLSHPEYFRDSTVAVGMALLMLLMPGPGGSRLIEWDDVRKIPLGILFLFGGGFAIAEGIMYSGLSTWLGLQLQGMASWPLILILIALPLGMTFFTELTSNTASTWLVLPILLALSAYVNIPPFLLMFPVVISASYAFMLPVATPPNTIVFATEQLKIKDMAKTGLMLNLLGVVLLSLLMWGMHVLGISV